MALTPADLTQVRAEIAQYILDNGKRVDQLDLDSALNLADLIYTIQASDSKSKFTTLQILADFIQTQITAGDLRVLTPVGTIPLLKAIDTTSSATAPEGALISVLDSGVFYLSRTSVEVADDIDIVAPDTGPGRFLNVTKNVTAGADLTNSTLLFGDSTDTNHTIEFNLGLGAANPKFRFNSATNVFEIALDGVNFTGFGSPSNLGYTASTRTVSNDNGTGFVLPEATVSDPGLISSADKTKLDGLQNRFRGTYLSLAALQVAVPSGNDGDRANVDTGAGSDVVQYLWDVNGANWVVSSGGGGSGDVTGPVSSVNNEIAIYDSTTGKIIKNSGATITNNKLVGVNEYDAINTISTPHSRMFWEVLDVQGAGDVTLRDIRYFLQGFSDESRAGIESFFINQIAATGGNVSAIAVTTDEGSSNVEAVFAGIQVDPIKQVSGEWFDPDQILVNAVDETNNIVNEIAAVAIFAAQGDTLTIGYGDTFDVFRIEFQANGGEAGLTFEYSTGVGTWAVFHPIDNTNNFFLAGTVTFNRFEIPSWADSGNIYYIRVTRGAASMGVTTVTRIRIAVGFHYKWDKNGEITLRKIFLPTMTSITGGEVNVYYDQTSGEFKQGVVPGGGGGGSGDVVGPASATNEAIPVFDSTTGKLIKNSPVIIDTAGRMSGVTRLAVPAVSRPLVPNGMTFDFDVTYDPVYVQSGAVTFGRAGAGNVNGVVHQLTYTSNGNAINIQSYHKELVGTFAYMVANPGTYEMFFLNIQSGTRDLVLVFIPEAVSGGAANQVATITNLSSNTVNEGLAIATVVGIITSNAIPTMTGANIAGVDAAHFEVFDNSGTFQLRTLTVFDFGTPVDVGTNNVYDITLAAVNSEGTQASPTALQITVNSAVATVPGAPTALTATAGATGIIDLAWTAPASDGGSSITGYQIDRESPTGNGFSILVADTGNTNVTYQDTGLSDSTQYNYRISAINAIGVGAASNEDSATTIGVGLFDPSTITNFRLAWKVEDAVTANKSGWNGIDDYVEQLIELDNVGNGSPDPLRNLNAAGSFQVNEPLYVASGINSLPSAEYNDQEMVTGALSAPDQYDRPITRIIVVQPKTIASAIQRFVGNGASNPCQISINTANRPYGYSGGLGQFNDTGITPIVVDTTYVIAEVFNGVASKLYINEVLESTADTGTTGGPFTEFWQGNTTGASTGAHFWLAEEWIFEADLSTQNVSGPDNDMLRVINSLKIKYNI